MRKIVLLVLFALTGTLAFSQTDKFWSENTSSRSSIKTDKSVARQSFPKDFKLFNLNIEQLRQRLFSITGNQPTAQSAIITLPNADGGIERFEVFEASNFEPALQAQFPQIRAFSGKGLTDKFATLKLSISPAGIQTMLFRTDKENEFIEAYSEDHSTYAVFRSQRVKGSLPWTCSTEDKEMFSEWNGKIAGNNSNFTSSSAGELKTMRLAQSCNGEYSNYFGATSAAQVALVLAAYNATLTRANGVYEKDLALHLNLIAQTVDVIYYDPLTDPYTTLGAWNGQLQSTLNSIIGFDNYDIGHMFGASGGGGNAGCIGCVCGTLKGSGITSPADGIPAGDNFDIDYVVHEVGHQLGANHTFSMNIEAGGVNNKEVGSGITIMGYAGITNQDVAPHSIDIFHAISIQQIQNNLATKTCPITTSITANNATPVVAAHPNYTIPLSTPFELIGSATDANAGDALTYCWEQMDSGTSGTTGNNSVAIPTKLVGPNYLSFPATASSTRTFPRLATILNGLFVTGPLPGGDAVANIEALSSVARNLNFRLTVRDNSPYVAAGTIKVGQTAFTDMTVTVSNASGPFMVTSPNTVVSWEASSSQNVTWNVANSDLAPVSAANVDILLSTDGGLTFPTTLVANTPNDGSQIVVLPGTLTSTARIKIKAVGNIFFDISNTNFNIIAAASGFTFNASTAATVACGSPTTATVALATTATGGFALPINLTATIGVPAGTTVTFSTNPLAPGSSTNVTLNNVNTLAPGTYTIGVQGVAGTVTQNTTVSFVVSPGAAPAITTQPSSQTICVGANATFTAAASGTVSYQWQVSTGGGPFTNIAGATSASYTVTGATAAQNGNQYHVVVSTLCGSATSSNATLTVNSGASITTQPSNTTTCSGQNATFTVTAPGAGLTYQWQSAPSCAGPWTNIAGATSASYTVTSVTNAMNGFGYQVIVTGACGAPVTSNCATLTVGDAAAITGQPSNSTVCVGANTSFSVTTTGTVTYQWQVSTGGGPFTNIAGATTATLNLNAVTAAMSGNQYHVVVFNCSGTGIISNNVTLTVNTPVAITAQPVNVTVCSPAAASFTTTATGSGLTYQWQVSTNGGGTFTNIAGATSATYNVAATTPAMNGNQYHVIITGPCTPAGVTSSNATLTVNTPVSITTQPANTSICLPATSVSISTVATGTGVAYQWQVSTNGGTTFTNIAGANAATLTLSPVTPAMNGNVYQVVLSGTCTANLVSSQATLTVNSPVSITTQPSNEATCTGDDAVFTVAATSSSPQFITYQWQVSINGSPFVNIPGATTNTLTVPGNMVNNGNVYHVIVSGPPCGSVTSNDVTLTVNQRPGVVLAASEYTNITPYVRTSLYATVSPAGPTYIYQWYRNGVLVPSATASSLAIDVDNLGEYEVEVTNAATGCGTTSNTVRVSDSAAQAHELFIYPNPSTGQFQVRYYSATTAATSHMITVYDSKGARVYQKMYPVTRAYERMDVMLDNAAAGIYLVELRDASGKKLTTQRVMIQ